jgi:hypothetical protein
VRRATAARNTIGDGAIQRGEVVLGDMIAVEPEFLGVPDQLDTFIVLLPLAAYRALLKVIHQPNCNVMAFSATLCVRHRLNRVAAYRRDERSTGRRTTPAALARPLCAQPRMRGGGGEWSPVALEPDPSHPTGKAPGAKAAPLPARVDARDRLLFLASAASGRRVILTRGWRRIGWDEALTRPGIGAAAGSPPKMVPRPWPFPSRRRRPRRLPDAMP